MSFDSLGLSADILRAVAEQGYSEPTPIQRQAIPVVLAGRDLLASAQTGTGKTAGFTLPLLQKLSATATPVRGRRPVRALILTPTRELAAQVGENVSDYSKYLSLRSLVVFGGVSINPQMVKLRGGVDVLVATPGRLLDLAQQNAVDLSQVEILVLDEADRMLDMGFIHDIRRVLARLPAKRQNLLFSATFSDEIKGLAEKLLTNPEMIEVARRNTASEQVAQQVHFVDKKRKRELLSQLIGEGNWQQVLVFTRTKHGANHLAEQLGKDGITAAAIHGNKSQGARTRALADFKSGGIRVLVATDIAARGLDIEELPHVVNYELPNVAEDYVHRIGRTGRAAATGVALSLVCVDEHKLLRDIERLLKREIPRLAIEGYEPDPSIKAEPIINGRQQQSRGGAGGGGAGGGGRGRGQGGQGAGASRSSGDKRRQSQAAPQGDKPAARPRRPAPKRTGNV
ncbi:ATP-dependent RNA helicase RhlE [Pantoea sp. Bo_2]|uniref:ATP-dependent RNA helicase RhlE n=1 Tax=unclassified Pantoea TaxID=2630326 RepID=UPI0012322ABF|nr:MULTISPECIES: ATP-dependent RNA helicase RhlE [unclassified Pantoea]KAA5946919.1 ATP-dependent RNA helicase RhlE [Pantoea sp. VH_3]KAA5952268.1 ATP-dependent RNA helicase RhlE [Pantoea sp. VH_25]KAA5954436.1 ATP-dependent RNA helicase RhlE [Pantoea sp. VH_24]KAA5961447.1 ATP-dependent RNA helicase RhlE [Pantoea sp. VH_16]KAA5965681.1 ATP-dependent RNA helicase RhlE [Pantoea sp. VH_18]